MTKRFFSALLWAMACLALPATAWADKDNGVKDRAYWMAQNTSTDYATKAGDGTTLDVNKLKIITVRADGAEGTGAVDAVCRMLGNFTPAPSQGLFCTIVAMLENPIKETVNGTSTDIHGYIVIGKPKVDDTDGDFTPTKQYTTSSAVTHGSYDADKNWYNRDTKDVGIPMYITTTDYTGSGALDELYRSKTFKVVGVDFGAFANLRLANLRFILPSSVTYIGRSAFFYAGCNNDDNRPALAFHNIDNTDASVIRTDNNVETVRSLIADVAQTDKWKQWNNIEAIDAHSFAFSYFTSISDLFNFEKLKTLGPETLNEMNEATKSGYKNGCFYNSGIKKIDFGALPNLVDKYVPHGAFGYCQNLEEVVIGEGFTAIHPYAFHNQYNNKKDSKSKLARVTLPNSLETIGEYAFFKQLPLTQVTFPDRTAAKLTTIENNAFENCEDLSIFAMPTHVKTIGKEAFSGCSFKGRYDMPPYIEYIGEQAYYGSNNQITHIYIPATVGKDNPLTLGINAFSMVGSARIQSSGNTSTKTPLFVELESVVPQKIRMEGSKLSEFAFTRGYVKNGSFSTHNVNFIVPMGSGELYIHTPNQFGNEYQNHYQWYTKFDLSRKYDLPDYGLPLKDNDGNPIQDADGNYTYAKAPWRIFTASWGNDIYTFKPADGGSIYQWKENTEYTHNTDGDTEKKCYMGDVISKFASATEATNATFWDGTGTLSTTTNYVLQPRRAHKYFDNTYSTDGIPRISTYEVTDGILPPGEGVMIAVQKDMAGNYLVPLYSAPDFLNSRTGNDNFTGTKQSFVHTEAPTTLDAYTDALNGRMGGSEGVVAPADIKAKLTSLTADSYWLDVLERWNDPIRDLYVYDGTSNTSAANAEMKGYYKVKTYITTTVDEDNNTVKKVYRYSDNTPLGTIGDTDASTGKPMFKFLDNPTDNAADRCCAYYKYYKFPATGVDEAWWKAKLEYGKDKQAFYDALTVVGELQVNWDFSSSYFNGTDQGSNNYSNPSAAEAKKHFSPLIWTDDAGGVHWLDIFNITWGRPIFVNIYEDEGRDKYDDAHKNLLDFYSDHTDNDNILVPRITNIKTGSVSLETGYDSEGNTGNFTYTGEDIYEKVHMANSADSYYKFYHSLTGDYQRFNGTPYYGYNSIVYPGYIVISSDNGNASELTTATTGKHYEYGWWEVLDDGTRRNNITVRGLTYNEMENLADGKDGFISFLLNSGMFYPVYAVNTMKPNKAFFRVHVNNLHANHKHWTKTATGGDTKGVIFIDEDDDVTTAIKTVDKLTSKQVDESSWYTLDGVRLNGTPTQKGIYLRGGKKVVVK